MRKVRYLAFFVPVALLTFLIGVFISRITLTLSHQEPSAWQVLLSFENQDLEGLDEQSGRLVRKAINELAPHKENDQIPPFEPRLFRTIDNTKGEQRYILVEESPQYILPGKSTLRICIFDKAGLLLNQQEFGTGWRAEIVSIRIRNLYQLEHQTLVVQGQYYFGGALFYQYYALSGNQIVMIYNQANLAFDSISYGSSDVEVGPLTERSADEWQEALESSDTVDILSALMWFSGSHSDVDPGTEGTKFLTVRARASVQKRLSELSESNNFWIKSVAATIMANHPTD